jgi:hypothetical protein
MHRIFLFILLFSILWQPCSAQKKNHSTLYGTILNTKGQPIEFINVSLKGFEGGTASRNDGTFQLSIPSGRKISLVFSHLNYQTQQKEVHLNSGEKKKLKIVMISKDQKLSEVLIKGNNKTRRNVISVDSKLLNKVPVSSSGAVEQLIKTLPGVSSNNELSSQYSVRGGNFDENLIYVNDIEVYRPYLVRSGQQEGLSFINSDLVSAIQFSSGGFDAKYGDKMSSVLDIRYKTPTEFEASASVSLLGASAHIADQSKNKKFSYLTGIRYKTNSYLLSSLDTKGEYEPRHTDFQGLFNYKLNEQLEVQVFGSISKNRYLFRPTDRETSFGTINTPLKLRMFFDGQEKDQFFNHMEAVTLQYHPNSNNLIKLIASHFESEEEETFDIQGQYYLNELFTTQGGDQDESLEHLGIGTTLDHARNELNLTVSTIELKGSHNFGKQFLQWGVKAKEESIHDKINEWQYRDSAGYSIPFANDKVLLAYSRNAKNRITSRHLSSFLQNTFSWEGTKGEFQLTTGIRYHYWDYNREHYYSPRLSLVYLPAWAPNFRFRIASGYYQQVPSYREMLTISGTVSENINAQKSIHYVLGQEYYFKAWNRPFKFSTELYYKDLRTLLPYEIDNVRIRYYGNQRAKGYATGLDLRINGEFVPGTESWASLSVMRTKEDIVGDGKGYIPRPTDQSINFSMFFQDYLPNNPSYKMQLSLFYGGGLPFWSPKTGKQGKAFRMPAYRRVDLGFSKVLIDKNKRQYKGILRHFKSLWLSMEIFNLLDINNTISYFWINDIRSNQYAVPNYLTSRKLNFKLSAKF